MTLEYSVWIPPDNLAYLLTQKYSRIIVYAQQEWQYTVFHGIEELIDYSLINDVPLYIIVCTGEYSILHELSDPRFKNVHLIRWDSFWLTHSLESFKDVGVLTAVNTTFKYPFISRNNRPHYHRCVLMDTLAKFNLIDRGAVSWLETGYQQETGPELPSSNRGYRFKYWTPVRRVLDQHFADHTCSLNIRPIQYEQSFMQVISESTTASFVVTEKTAASIFLKKLFLVHAAPGYHSMLNKYYGIEKYDELFDYGFDANPDIVARAEGLAENVYRITSMSATEWAYWYNKLLPKLIHNQKIFLDRALDKTSIPDLIYETRTSIFSTSELVSFVEKCENINI